MKNKVNIQDVGKKDKPEVIVTSFNFEKKEYHKFKGNLKLLNLKVTDVLQEFIKRVNVVFKSGGGEVIFGIEPIKKK